MINIWQGLEIVSVVFGISKALRKHGQFVVTQEVREKIMAHSELEQVVFDNLTMILATVFSLFWVVVAYMGNCTGLGLWLYVGFCGAIYGIGVHIFQNEELRYSVKHNIYRTIATFGLANYFLYLGGFWNGI